jgi:RNA polymerase sigma-70 factor (ECF subfamily)
VDEALFKSTSTSLVRRLQDIPRDEEAWDRFVRGYAPAIRRWCRAWRLQEADADDVTQAILLKLARTMARFQYDRSRSFRGYLKTLTRYAVCDALETLRRQERDAGRLELIEWLGVVDTRHDLARCLEAQLRENLFAEAAERVSQRIDPRTWEAFRLRAQEHRSGQEVADRLGMTVAAVYMAKSRVLAMMREEILQLTRKRASPAS